MKQKEICAEIIINASIQDVWRVLTDIKNYPKWNPFIVASEGELKVGKKIKNTLLNGKKEMIFTPTITEFDPNYRLAWLGSLGFRGIFDGNHSFELHRLEEGKTKLIQHERFTGLFAGLILKFIKEDTLSSFEAMNEALKTVAEKSSLENAS